jgi:hypothetical protein
LLDEELGALRSELRTREARGAGTDVRLVLIEAKTVRMCLSDLDRWLGERVDELGELHAALTNGSPVFDRLDAEWEGLDLQEVTVCMREITDLLGLLVSS